MSAFRKAIAVNAEFAEAHVELACRLLAMGEFAEGWQEYEARVIAETDGNRKSGAGRFANEQWRGNPLAGGSLVVAGEQGIGDEIWLSGMVGELRERTGAGRIVIECSAKLVKLFERSFGGEKAGVKVEIVAKTDPPDARCIEGVDVQIAAGSLGQYLRPELASFPKRESSGGAYLFADQTREAVWREQFKTLGPGLKVGVSWRSSNTQGERALSCTRLTQWGEIFKVSGIQWVNVQYDDCEAELREAEEKFGVKIQRYPEVDMYNDLDETAALMRGLDLVISAPTSVAIMSAALGVPTWQMNYGIDWQCHGQANCPWYPAMTNYPRRWDQPWEEILATIARDLPRFDRGLAASTGQEKARA
jgi:hypothetical protein